MDDTIEKLPDLIDVATVAKHLHVKPRTIRKKINKNEIPAIKIGRLYRIPKVWLIDLHKSYMER